MRTQPSDRWHRASPLAFVTREYTGRTMTRRRTQRVRQQAVAPSLMTMLFAIMSLIVMALALAGFAVGADFSPMALGIRSALAGSALQKSSWRLAKSRTKQHSSAPAVFPISTEDDDFFASQASHGRAETAFFRPRSSREDAQMRSAQSAYLKRESRSVESGTELDFLESTRDRSSSSKRNGVLVSTVPQSAAGATTATSITLSQQRQQQQQQQQQEQQVAAAASRGGGGGDMRPLVFWENMVCGAISRSVAQTIMHPANTMKTLLQNARGPDAPTIFELMQPHNFRRLTVGAGANFLLSVPHGAVNFAVLELVRKKLGAVVKANPYLAANEERLSFGLDFLSSSISTITCSVVSTPQMMVTDNIMAGNYPNLFAAVTGLARSKGLLGFYGGWWPGLVGKIPSYALTWTFFQQLKQARNRWNPHRPSTDVENSVMGCFASAATVCLMIPMDTIKTRLVSQAGRAASDQAYKGIIDCAVRVFREEGMATFYRGLPPRLVSVVPMIGIQFGVYEFMKRVMLQRRVAEIHRMRLMPDYGSAAVLQEAMMEVAASPEHPYPAPQFTKRVLDENGDSANSKPKKSQKKAFGPVKKSR